jgi:hypothetical protein
MQMRRLLQFAACVLVLAGLSFADSMGDPKIVIGGNGGQPFLNTVTVGNNFSFLSPSGTSPGTSPCEVFGEIQDNDCSFINGTNLTFTSLLFKITPTQGNLSCDGGTFFLQCSVNDQLGTITFSQCNTDGCGTGIGPGVFFTTSVEGFLAGSNFDVTASSVSTPEPATLVLVLTGAAEFFRRRRRQ